MLLALAAALPDAGSISVPGAKLHWVAEGKGTPCVVIGSSVYYPRTFSAELKKRFRFYFVDLRWFTPDLVNDSPVGTTRQSLSDDVERIRKGLGLHKMVLVGHSIHGCLAFEYARRHPERVSRLVLIGSPPDFANASYDAAVERAWKTASAERQAIQAANWKHPERFRQSPREPVVEDYLAMAPKYWANPRYDASWLWHGMKIHTELLKSLYSTVFSPYQMLGSPAKVPVPTWVAMGKYDYAVPASLWDRYRGVKGLRVTTFAQSGHTPQLEEPEAFDAEFSRWVVGVSR